MRVRDWILWNAIDYLPDSGAGFRPYMFAVDPNGTSNALVANTLTNWADSAFRGNMDGCHPAVRDDSGVYPSAYRQFGTATTFTSATLNTTINQDV